MYGWTYFYDVINDLLIHYVVDSIMEAFFIVLTIDFLIASIYLDTLSGHQLFDADCT